MSSARTNHWKLGLFVVAGFCAAVAAVFWIGAQRLRRDTIAVVTYFQEPVQGLEPGSPVKMRGVTIGSVRDITVAPDRRSVEVRAGIYTDVLQKLGLGGEAELYDGDGRLGPVDLRTQIAMAGITGAKYVLVDFFPLEDNPLPLLDFDPPENYVASVPSTLKNIEDGLNILVETLPRATEEFSLMAATLTRKLDDLDVALLSERLARLLGTLDEKLAVVDARALSDELSALLAELRRGVEELRAGDGPIGAAAEAWSALAGRLERAVDEAEVGATARALRASAGAVGRVAHDSGDVTIELRRDLVAFREAMEALRALALFLERDPGAVLRGRSQ